jgi:hypothetical protein
MAELGFDQQAVTHQEDAAPVQSPVGGRDLIDDEST